MVLWLKGLAIGFAAGAVTMGIVALFSHRTESTELAPKGSAEAARTADSQLDAPAPPVARVQALATDETAAAHATAMSAPLPSPVTSLDSDPAKALRPNRAGELAALDSAHAALAAKNPEAALAELEHYERKYPSMAFGLRAQLLRIEALAAAGRPQSARELAATYITTYPDSSHAPQLRAFVAGQPWSPP